MFGRRQNSNQARMCLGLVLIRGMVENAERCGCADQFLLVETVTWPIVFVLDSICCSIQFVLPIHYHQGQAHQTVSQGLVLIACGQLVDFICLYLIRSIFYTNILLRSAHPLSSDGLIRCGQFSIPTAQSDVRCSQMSDAVISQSHFLPLWVITATALTVLMAGRQGSRR